jgi:hypothetical protein
MRFSFFYEELLQEQKGRPMSPEKFEAITQNIGRWMYNYFGDHPLQLSRIPYFSELREFARENAGPGENVDDIEQLVLMLNPDEDSNLMYGYLNQIPQVLKAQEIIKKIGDTFEPIGKRIKYFDRADDYVPVRGRKPKERTEKDFEEKIPVISKSEKKDIEDLLEPKRKGRKPSVQTLEKLQGQYLKMYDDLEKQIKRMRELSSKIDDYRKYFGK